MKTTSTKAELSEKVGKTNFLSNAYTLAAKLNYESGIDDFDKYLNGRTLNQINAVIHMTKFPKGLVIKIAKLFSSVHFGLTFSEIKQISLSEKSGISYLIIETNKNINIVFSFKPESSVEIRQFLEDIDINYQNNKPKILNEEINLKVQRNWIIAYVVIIALILIGNIGDNDSSSSSSKGYYVNTTTYVATSKSSFDEMFMYINDGDNQALSTLMSYGEVQTLSAGTKVNLISSHFSYCVVRRQGSTSKLWVVKEHISKD
jgi:hypothetical protein